MGRFSHLATRPERGPADLGEAFRKARDDEDQLWLLAVGESRRL